MSVKKPPLNTPSVEDNVAYTVDGTCGVGGSALIGGSEGAPLSAVAEAGAVTEKIEGPLQADLPAEVVLEGARPNPTSSFTAIRYGLPAAARVRLRLYDVTGRLVATVVDGERGAGYHEAVVEGDPLPSGAYLYRLEAGGRVLTGRLTIAR